VLCFRAFCIWWHFLYIFLEHSTTISNRKLSFFPRYQAFYIVLGFRGFLYIAFCILLCFRAFSVVKAFCILLLYRARYSGFLYAVSCHVFKLLVFDHDRPSSSYSQLRNWTVFSSPILINSILVCTILWVEHNGHRRIQILFPSHPSFLLMSRIWIF